MPFLEVLTRCYKRPFYLAMNQASLTVQTDPDWKQTLLIDNNGLGIGASHLRLRDYAPQLVGRYIWVLDDDDLCSRPTLVAELKQIAQDHDPDVIMLRMDHGPRGILPSDSNWERPPVEAGIGSAAFVIRRAVWQANAKGWTERYQGDYDFIRMVFSGRPSVYWYDVIASQVQQIGLGRPENDTI